MNRIIKWTDEKIEEEIIKVMKALNIKRMPTKKEIDLVTKNYGLSNKVCKSLGYEGWAKKLGLATKESETLLGNEYEEKIFDLLTEKGFKVEHMTAKHPYDILVNDNIKIDVKVSHWYQSNQSQFKYHTFGLGKRKHNCDIFICVGLDKNSEIYRIMIIPSKFIMNISQLSCGISSKYNQFIGRWDFLEKYDEFYKTLA